jgi:dihydrodipicolinate synthase/N-acetylneuraminate lyase
MLLEGMHLPLTTPFHVDGRLNTRKLEDNAVRYSKTPAAGLVVLGRSGQPTLLSDAETREVLRAAVAATVAEKVLTAGVARDSVSGALGVIDDAAALGYDAALVRVPSFLDRSAGVRRSEMLTYFHAIADRAALPVVIESARSGALALTEDLVAELAGHAGIIGLVDYGMDAGMDAARIGRLVQATAGFKRDVTVTMVFAAVTGRMQAKAAPEGAQMVSAVGLSGGAVSTSQGAAQGAAKVLKTRTKTVGFQVLSGRTAGMLDALQAGAVGAIPAFAAAAPQACYEVLAAWKDGDPALAAEKQHRIQRLAQRVEEEMGVAGIKYGCDLTGYFGGRPRLPGLPLTGSERSEIEALMAGIRN